MKTNSILTAAVLITVAACTKNFEEKTAPTVHAVVEAEVEAPTRVSTVYEGGVYKSTWEVGDEMAVAQLNRTAFEAGELTNVDALNKFVGAGSPVSFNGTITSCHEGSKYTILVPYSAFVSYSAKNTESTVNLPSSQTGFLSDLDDYYIRFLRQKEPELTIEGGIITDVKFTGVILNPLCPVIKINVPSSYNITNIRLTAKDSSSNDVVLSGNINLKFNDAKILNGTTSGTKYVEVDRGGSVISGDVYICVYPDTPTSLVSSATSLKFEFTNDLGASTEFNGPITSQLEAGKVKDLGTVNNIAFSSPECAINLAFDRSADRVVVTGSAGAAFTWSSSTSGEPSTPSTSYDPSTGIPIDSEITYLKVKGSAPGFSDAEVHAVMRVWKSHAFDAIALANKNDISTLNGCTWLNIKANANGRQVVGTATKTNVDKNVFVYATAPADNDYTVYVYTGLKAAANFGYYRNWTSAKSQAVGGTDPEDSSWSVSASAGDTIGIMGTEQQIYLYTIAVLEVGTISFP